MVLYMFHEMMDVKLAHSLYLNLKKKTLFRHSLGIARGHVYLYS
jgi:hypothetical protein